METSTSDRLLSSSGIVFLDEQCQCSPHPSAEQGLSVSATSLEDIPHPQCKRCQTKQRFQEANTFELETSETVTSDPGEDVVVQDCLELLSPKARMTYLRLPKLKLERWVKDVESQPAKRLKNTGDIYIGEWDIRTDGLSIRKGKGKLFTISKELFEGYWNNGKLQLQGRIIYANGSLYEGQFQNGERSGIGIYEKLHQKSRYIGAWEHDKRQGEGYYSTSTGYSCKGLFLNGALTGKGTEIHSDGWKYVGEFEAGVRHGTGTSTWKGYKYSGQWKDGLKHGKGKETTDVDEYEGNYALNKREGFGVSKNRVGHTVYEGDWHENLQHGVFFVTRDGVRKKVEYNHGLWIRNISE